MAPSSSSGSSTDLPVNSDNDPSSKPNFLAELIDSISTAITPESETEEDRIAARIAAGEGVVWSADYSRAWKSKKGMPQDEVSVQEGKRLSEELSIPIPTEVK